MKEEKEFLWNLKLLDSKLIKGIFIKRDGCKRDFERIAGASENSYYFRKWLSFLINKGFIEINGERPIGRSGKKVQTYIINYSKLMGYFKKTEMFRLARRVILNEELGLK